MLAERGIGNAAPCAGERRLGHRLSVLDGARRGPREDSEGVAPRYASSPRAIRRSVEEGVAKSLAGPLDGTPIGRSN